MRNKKLDKAWIIKLEGVIAYASLREVAKWIEDVLAHHIVYAKDMQKDIESAINAIDLWLAGELKVIDLKARAYLFHDLARKANSQTHRYVYRACGHACATAHVKEHAIKASNYIIHAHLSILDRIEDIEHRERSWQYAHLLNISIKA